MEGFIQAETGRVVKGYKRIPGEIPTLNFQILRQ